MYYFITGESFPLSIDFIRLKSYKVNVGDEVFCMCLHFTIYQLNEMLVWFKIRTSTKKSVLYPCRVFFFFWFFSNALLQSQDIEVFLEIPQFECYRNT